MSKNSSKETKRYKTSAILFSICGVLSIIVAIISSKIGIYLPIGIAFIIISIVIWQYGIKLTENEDSSSSE